MSSQYATLAALGAAAATPADTRVTEGIVGTGEGPVVVVVHSGGETGGGQREREKERERERSGCS